MKPKPPPRRKLIRRAGFQPAGSPGILPGFVLLEMAEI
jgi:hypothetical protein